jgi:hypothetical protein
MEICTYIVEGSLTHKDSTGTRETIGRGGIQFMVLPRPLPPPVAKPYWVWGLARDYSRIRGGRGRGAVGGGGIQK